MDSGHHLQSALSSLHAAQGMMSQNGGSSSHQHQPVPQHEQEHRPARLDLSESYLSEAGPSTYFNGFSADQSQYHDPRHLDPRQGVRDSYEGDGNGLESDFEYLDHEGAELVDIPEFPPAPRLASGNTNGQTSTNTSASPAAPTRPGTTHAPEPGRSLEDIIAHFWAEQMHQVEQEPINLKHGSAPEGSAGAGGALPLARIKKVMKSDPEVKMISAEAPVLLAKACEIFITELTTRAWQVAEQHKRRTLQKSDVAGAIVGADMFDFLLDIVPREEAVSKSELGQKRRNEKNAMKREEKRRKQQEDDQPEEGAQDDGADVEVQADVG